MTLTLSDLTCTTFTGGLGALRSVLTAAQEHATAESLPISELLDGRLAPDMFTFLQQVQAATDTARRVTDRLSGKEATSQPDPEASIEALTERVDLTVRHVSSADAASIDAIAERTLSVDLGAGPMEFTGRSYALGFALPNFLFHVTTGYDIMRHQGVALGKLAYIMPFMAACGRS